MIKIPLEIPQTLGEEETKDPLSFHSMEEVIVAIVLGIISVLLLMKLPFVFFWNLAIVTIFAVGSFEGYRYLRQNYFKWKLYKHSFHEVSFFDLKMDDFLNIKDIKNQTIIFDDNTFISILKVTPIDGGLLDDEDLNAVVEAYGSTLKSIQHSIFIFSHSVEPNLDSFFDLTDQKIINQGGNYEENLKNNKAKQKWLMEKMQETDARDRLNYFGILYKKKSMAMSFKGAFAYLLGAKKREQISKKRPIEEKQNKIIREILTVINNTGRQLEKTGVKTGVLTDEELINLYSSYFLNIREVGKSNLSPIMWGEDLE